VRSAPHTKQLDFLGELQILVAKDDGQNASSDNIAFAPKRANRGIPRLLGKLGNYEQTTNFHIELLASTTQVQRLN